MLPVVNNQVRPWFEQYGATLDDRTTFRHMIEMAEKDIASLEALMPEYREKASDVAAECESELTSARILVARMKHRLEAILAGP